jgi:hypothetical protein
MAGRELALRRASLESDCILFSLLDLAGRKGFSCNGERSSVHVNIPREPMRCLEKIACREEDAGDDAAHSIKDNIARCEPTTSKYSYKHPASPVRNVLVLSI